MSFFCDNCNNTKAKKIKLNILEIEKTLIIQKLCKTSLTHSELGYLVSSLFYEEDLD
jgi:hypothetical protein